MRLFEPLEIGHLKIDNRIAFAPTHMGQATNRGEVNDQVLCHYSARAKGGAGLIIVQAVGVTAKYGGSFANRMASLSRALIADPDWPKKAREGRFDEINRCIFCYTCIKSIVFEGKPVRCSRNPEVGWERFLPKYFPEPRRKNRT